MSRAIFHWRAARRIRLPEPGSVRRTPAAPGRLASERPDAWLRRPKHLLLAAGGAIIAITAGATRSCSPYKADETPPAESATGSVSDGGLTLSSAARLGALGWHAPASRDVVYGHHARRALLEDPPRRRVGSP